jgi:hypothetical protein
MGFLVFFSFPFSFSHCWCLNSGLVGRCPTT